MNLRSIGEEGFTALHFAAFYGNIQLIELLLKHGANMYALNHQGIDMMHVSAQGDQPCSLNYFRLRGLDVNSRDRKQGTPLHWAAFSGSELALSYLLAWDADVEAKDSKGLTALHLAVK
jgi:palmitoyltransferase ZDHHC13/17